MNLEWAQILTQAIGFLIALWVLKKFAWKPVSRLLEERRLRIASEFAKIEEEKKKLTDLFADYQAKLKEIDSLARQKILEAIQEGQKVALEIKENARTDAKEILKKAQFEVEQELAKAKVQLRDDVVNMTLAVTEKIIQEKLDETKNRKLIEQFISEVEKTF